MQLRYTNSNTNEDILFVNDIGLAEYSIERIEHTIKGSYGEVYSKAILLKGLLLNYTRVRLNQQISFTVNIEPDVIVNSFHLHGAIEITNNQYEPYRVHVEEFFNNYLVKKGNVCGQSPQVVDLFRIIMSPEYYLELLENYGDTFKEIIEMIHSGYKEELFKQPLPISPQMKILIREVLTYNNVNDKLSRIYYKTKALEILHMQLEYVLALSVNKSVVKLSNSDVLKMYEAQKILNVNFHAPPSIKQLAAILATNENKLKSGYNQIFNTSIYQYILQLRLDHSIELMRNPDMSIEEISDKIGYANISHFTRAFKRVKGVTPSLYRASL